MSDHFYYSEKQKEAYKRVYDMELVDTYGQNYCLIDGKEYPYTECSDGQKESKWDDMVYLGKGTISRRETIEKRPSKFGFMGENPMEAAIKGLMACKIILNEPFDLADYLNNNEKAEEKEEWPDLIG